MESMLRNVETLRINVSGAQSRISDADVAFESSNLVRSNILQQMSASVLAQANQEPALALKLLT
jgi:flagellin